VTVESQVIAWLGNLQQAYRASWIEMSTGAIARDTFGVFGTTAVLLVAGRRDVGEARAIADEELAAVDLACSRFRPDSELSRLNAAAGKSVVVSQTLASLIATALRAAEVTGGDVDPTCGAALVALGYDRDFPEVQASSGPAGLPRMAGPVPGWQNVRLDEQDRSVRLDKGAQLDLGATAKAWAADQCAWQIADRMRCGVLVSLGGDVAVAGEAPPGGWRIRVTDDHAAPDSAPGQTVAIASGGLATSSTTVRAWLAGGSHVHHIVNPATGAPAASCWRTVSVAAGTCTDANIASTAAIIRSSDAPEWLSELALPARLVGQDGAVVTTPGWPADGE
jgi:FAD:protein FMN transferase